jgi:hypothetical protein
MAALVFQVLIQSLQLHMLAVAAVDHMLDRAAQVAQVVAALAQDKPQQRLGQLILVAVAVEVMVVVA